MRRRLLIALCAVVVFRLGQNLPLPGVDITSRPPQVSGLVDLLTGSDLRRPAVFSLGVLPLYAARFTTSLLVGVVPRMKALSEHEPLGVDRLMRLTRALALCLGAVLGTAHLFWADAFHDRGPLASVTLVAGTTAGTALTIRLVELITTHGTGNGLNLLLFTQVAAVFPGQLLGAGTPALVVVPAIGMVIVVAVITARQAQRRIPVQRAKRLMGRWPYGTAHVYVPIRVDQAGYNPMVWASLLLYAPAWLWHLSSPWYLAASFALVVLGMYIRARGVLDPEEVADRITRQGGFIPGVPRGKATADYLGNVRSRLAWCNALYAGLVVLAPMVALALLDISPRSALTAPGILVATGISMIVARYVVKETESTLAMREYAPYLR
ncbi:MULTISPECIES: preprotein translocase subunit SecY [unclassified Streptomyces]|uniref:preprotein translocase subunit SecY n=1 Tax=unclassified Streptomyces TaxID=2593676 RepID=UPI003655A8EF